MHRTVLYQFQLKLQLSWYYNFFLGVASGQTSLQISSCLTKEQNLRMSCKFTPAADLKLPKNCYYKTETELIGNSNSSIVPDSTFKNRANVSISDTTCELYLKGFSDDKPQNYTCFIKQTASPVSVSAIVDKSKTSFLKENNSPY